MAQDVRVDEEKATLHRANVLGLPYIDTSLISEKVLFKGLLETEQLRGLRVIPIHASDHRIDFGVTNTTSQKTIQGLRHKFQDQQQTFSMISDTGFRDYMKLYDPPKEIVYEDIQITAGSDEDFLAKVNETLNQVRPDDMLAYIVQQAFNLNASDIHLESMQDGARIRLRVHGVLHTVAKLSKDRYRLLLAGLASAANISTSVDSDQTGHINSTYTLATGDNVVVNLRVESVPAVNGTDVVLRIFNFRVDMLRLDRMGMSDKQESIFKEIISHPSGLVLIVGPTGSGKSTTLYSLLNELNTDERKIITLEDPVEYQIEGITQIPVNSRQGQNFADKFRAVLRLDPDVIMVGEIRDIDTAKTALQAALTGHLVLSTYHASSAAAALTRLLDAIGENPLYASAIRLIQAQRLVRRLDDSTKMVAQIDDVLKEHLHRVLDSINGVPNVQELKDGQIFEPGKSPENPFGFNGQFALREMLTMTPEMQRTLTRPIHELTTDVLEEVAIKSGMIKMEQEGVMAVMKGLTTYKEISRVIG